MTLETPAPSIRAISLAGLALCSKIPIAFITDIVVTVTALIAVESRTIRCDRPVADVTMCVDG